MIHGHHRVALEDAVLLREVAFGEGLVHVSQLQDPGTLDGDSYVLIMLLANLLTRELLEPLLSLVTCKLSKRLAPWNIVYDILNATVSMDLGQVKTSKSRFRIHLSWLLALHIVCTYTSWPS